MRANRPRVSLSLLAAAIFAAAALAEDEPTLTETVTVTATRLAPEPESIERVPAHVTVLDRESIERTGARTVQDVLALEGGVVLYDQVGNDIEKTFDLRGFSQGTGTRVFLDGAPLNDSRNNAVALDLVPLEALEAIEISRGSASALAGGGAEAGVIHLRTRRGEGLGGSLSLSAGTDSTENLAGEAHGGGERFDFFVSGSGLDTDGFRENAGGDVRRLAGTLGARLGAEGRLALSLASTDSELGNPGALTEAEIESDSSAAPYNQLDFSEQTLRQATLGYRGPLGTAWSISANLFGRERTSEILSTGRSADDFGGFFLDSQADEFGSTVQVTHDRAWQRTSNRFIAGLEWVEGQTDALGYFTPPADPGTVDRASPASDNTTDRRTAAVYVQDVWTPSPAWTLVAGARADEDRVDYSDALDPTITDSRTFSEISLRAGAHWQFADRHGAWASYGEGFLPPTSEELFAFPLFGSNRKLEPEDSRSIEVGYRAHLTDTAQLDVALFRIDTEDEIAFVPDPPPAFFTGTNQNVGETRRDGAEIALHGRIASRARAFARITYVDAEFANGDNEGADVPLVPRERYSAGIDVDLTRALALRVDGLWVGEQVVDNDPANAQSPLDSYAVANARLSWNATWWQGAPGRRGLELWAGVRNMLDEEYATRAIFAGETFFTPAPGRRWLAGATWLF